MGFRVAYLSTSGFPSFPRPGVQHPAFCEEVDGSASEAEVEAGAEVFLGALDHAPLPSDS